jgi:hypothetical protein
VLTGEGDEVGGFPYPLYVLVENAHRSRLGREAGEGGRVHTPRGRCSGRHPSSSTPSPSA